jgi:hypothetical protein
MVMCDLFVLKVYDLFFSTLHNAKSNNFEMCSKKNKTLL